MKNILLKHFNEEPCACDQRIKEKTKKFGVQPFREGRSRRRGEESEVREWELTGDGRTGKGFWGNFRRKDVVLGKMKKGGRGGFQSPMHLVKEGKLKKRVQQTRGISS